MADSKINAPTSATSRDISTSRVRGAHSDTNETARPVSVFQTSPARPLEALHGVPHAGDAGRRAGGAVIAALADDAAVGPLGAAPVAIAEGRGGRNRRRRRRRQDGGEHDGADDDRDQRQEDEEIVAAGGHSLISRTRGGRQARRPRPRYATRRRAKSRGG